MQAVKIQNLNDFITSPLYLQHFLQQRVVHRHPDRLLFPRVPRQHARRQLRGIHGTRLGPRRPSLHRDWQLLKLNHAHSVNNTNEKRIEP